MARRRYPTDLPDPQWSILEPLILPSKPGGCPRSIDMREVVNTIFYVLRGGIPWRMLPHDLPPGRRCTITSVSGVSMVGGKS